jgi:YihY family inner membrane protein
MNPMKPPQAGLSRLAHRFDAFQQRHRMLAFPAAIWRELEDQRVNYLTALLTYYAFVSLFPALLILTTVLGAVLRHDPGLQERVLNSALVDFPVIGQELKNNIHGIGRNGAGLAIGIVVTFLGAMGLANAARDVMNELWGVPRSRRPGFPKSWLRSLALMSVLGLAVVTTTILSGIGEWSASSRFSDGARVLLLAASLATTILLFWLGMRIAVAGEVAWRDLMIGAVLAGVFFQGLQWVGGLLVAHQLRRANALYGVFGIILGLIAWLYLQARLTLYAVSVDVVRAQRKWPRSLFAEDPGKPMVRRSRD